MNSSRKAEEIRATVQTIGKVRSAKELDNLRMRKRVQQLFDNMDEFYEHKIPEPAASEFIATFLSGEPAKAYINLVELRSGRSVGDPLSHSLFMWTSKTDSRTSHSSTGTSTLYLGIRWSAQMSALSTSQAAVWRLHSTN